VSAVLAWEVDYPDGSVVYRGRDIELAEELYYLAPPGSHLIPAAPEATEREATAAPARLLLSRGDQ
jgi:hypothetical protein